MRQENGYQITLIVSAILGTALFGAFFYKELFPEYKIYQNAYVDLEEFRSSYTGNPPPPFKPGVKQIVLPKSDKGPETIDRCTSCHVALQFQHFSPTQIARSVNGEILYDAAGIPKKEPNPEYIWTKLDERIEALRSEGKEGEAEELAALKTARLGEHEYSMEKVLQMHPLMGKETRPFEFHPMDEYGCTVCHGGNGRGLTTDRAHGAVFDGTYEESYMGPKPQFLEVDSENDPLIAKAYNEKPGHKLLFQTKPLLIGGLIESSCVQCHQPTDTLVQNALTNLEGAKAQAREGQKVLQQALEEEYNAVISLLSMRALLEEKGAEETFNSIQTNAKDFALAAEERKRWAANAQFLGREIVANEKDPKALTKLLKRVDEELLVLLGDKEELEKALAAYAKNRDLTAETLEELLEPKGSIGQKRMVLAHKKLFAPERLQNLQLEARSDLDRLTLSYQRGKELFITQACYACHRIEGFSRGGIGPELTYEGEREPWFVKESIVWPQADLKNSTMPNYKLDHEEIEDLLAFLMAQRQETKSIAEMERRVRVKAWEEGKKTVWEEEVPASEIRNVRKTQGIFATQGCAACHRLKGYDSNVGFANEDDFDALVEQRAWFQKLFPEDILGSTLIERVAAHKEEIDRRILPDVRSEGLLEELAANYPQLIESFYPNFKFALRGSEDRERVRRVMMLYIQEYGLGRLVGPRLNWSGVYRSDKWLMEHFWNPSALVARSIMPVFPFDNTKFLALTYMLDVLGQQNRDALREVWSVKGFNPKEAFSTLCAQCHGENLKGNGPVAEWIYPIPKNLGNPVFLRNLTKQRAYESIMHGVQGGPMPPMGEAAPDKPFANAQPVLTSDEVKELVNWIYRALPGERYLREKEEVRKWEYQPEDVIEELKDAGDDQKLKTNPELASLVPLVAARSLQVADLFHVVDVEGEKKYYIKKEYYTPQNLAEGRAFFELHCAVCHGKDGDGAGVRAEVMEDAKPRMLINLPWIESRDDLRLIRSLVYGVQGTSMTPWGDQTTALQRLQLVMYIRSLTETKRLKTKFDELIYEQYQREVWALEKGREEVSKKIGSLEEEEKNIESGRRAFESAGEIKKATALYAEQQQKMRELTAAREEDQKMRSAISLVQQEKQSAIEVGNALLALFGSSEIVELFFQSISDEGVTYEKQVEEKLATEKNSLEEQKIYLQGQIRNAELQEEQKDLDAKLARTQAVMNDLKAFFAEKRRLKTQKMELMDNT